MRSSLALLVLLTACGVSTATDEPGHGFATLPGSDAEPEPSPGPTPFPIYFAIHAVEVDYDITTAKIAFEEVKALGGTGVRTDIFWRDVEPAADVWSESAWQFYDDYVTAARAAGLEPMIIVSGAPSWVIGAPDFWEQYEQYVTEAVARVGDRVDRWQLWNEANHFIDPVPEADDWQLFARAGEIIPEDATTYVNVMANLAGWEDAVTDWLINAGEYIDVIGVDHYPVTWACCMATDWQPLDRLLERTATPGDVWFGKTPAVLETGYSSWAAVFADEAAQRAWIDAALPEIRARKDRLESVTWYQLADVDTGGWGQEMHFGILRSDFSPKPGAADLAEHIALFN